MPTSLVTTQRPGGGIEAMRYHCRTPGARRRVDHRLASRTRRRRHSPAPRRRTHRARPTATGGATLSAEDRAVVVIDVATGARCSPMCLRLPDGPTRLPLAASTPKIRGCDPRSRRRSRRSHRDRPSKVIVAAAALDVGIIATLPLRTPRVSRPWAGSPIRNASDGFCSDENTLALTGALVVSCNTVFAALAVDLGGCIRRRSGTASRVPEQ